MIRIDSGKREYGKMRKKLLSLLLAVLLFLGMALPALADSEARDISFEADLAYGLKALGLFEGVSARNFDLERAPTRTEALIMLIRLLGRDAEARESDFATPFTDVDDWAQGYIGYGYKIGLTEGETDHLFGSASDASANMYLTFILRALGYSEGEGEDYVWDDPWDLAEEVGILPETVDRNKFLRADVVTVSYAALSSKMKDYDMTLAEVLIENGVFTQEQFEACYDPNAATLGDVNNGIAFETKELVLRETLDCGLDITGLTYINYGTVFFIGDAGYEAYNRYHTGQKKVADQVSAAAEALDGQARVFCLIAPNSLGVVLSKHSFDWICNENFDEGIGISESYAYMSDKVYTVDAYSTLRAHNDEYVYLRTDHHWSALGAYYAYSEYARTAGIEPADLEEDFTTLDMTGHLGLFYSLCGYPYQMKANPDTVTAYVPKSDIDTTVTNVYGNTFTGQLVYDYTSSIYSYKYGAFIGGDNPLTVITNNDIEDDSACILIKDSYGNPFAVYLTQNYKTVYVMDYRYYMKVSSSTALSNFVEAHGVDDVIFLLSMTLSQADGTAYYLSKFCR